MGKAWPGTRGWEGGFGWQGGRRGRVGGIMGEDGGCYKLICDVTEQRIVNLYSEFRDIH